MPIHLKGTGEVDAFIQQSGNKAPCKVWRQTADGKELIYAPVQIIDDFEDGNRDGWTVPSSTDSDTIVSPGLNGTDSAWKLNGLREGHLAGADAVDRGPQPGDLFEFLFRATDFSGEPALFRFEFSCSGVDDGNMYRIEFEGSNTSRADASLEKYVEGSPTKINTMAVSPSVGDNCMVRVGWNDSGSDIYANYFENGSYQATASITDTEYSQPGVCVWANSNIDVIVDEIRIPTS